MKKLFHIYLPTLRQRTIDLRRWYYVDIDGERMDWWDCECCIKDTKERYPEAKFTKIPLYKTILK